MPHTKVSDTHTHTVTERDRAILRRVWTVITVGVGGKFVVAKGGQREWAFGALNPVWSL